jgi:hypothetical protein
VTAPAPPPSRPDGTVSSRTDAPAGHRRPGPPSSRARHGASAPATVAALAAGGWRVIAADRCADDPALQYPLGTPADLDRVVEAARPAEGDVVGYVADTRDPDALAAAVGEASGAGVGSTRRSPSPGSSRAGPPPGRFPRERRRPSSTSTSAGY